MATVILMTKVKERHNYTTLTSMIRVFASEANLRAQICNLLAAVHDVATLSRTTVEVTDANSVGTLELGNP